MSGRGEPIRIGDEKDELDELSRSIADRGILRLVRQFRKGEWTPPRLAEEAFRGTAGRWVEAVAPYTEAPPPALLLSNLVAFGNAVGRTAHVCVTATRHHANEYLMIVGPTASGRKGEAMRIGARPVRLADPVWTKRELGGFGSGEAVVDETRDPVVEWDEETQETRTIDAGAADKRLLVFEEEFASVLAVASRDGSTLSPLLRKAWDSLPLENRTRGRGRAVATDTHISVVAGITPTELRHGVGELEVANGFLNRFLIAAAKREKHVPRPPPIPGNVENGYVDATRTALEHARSVGKMRFDATAGKKWDVAYERELSVDRPGLAGAACSRAEPHTLRLAVIYALLDRSKLIRSDHLEAALAVWRYCEASAYLVFGDSLGEPIADAILDALRSSATGLTRTEISAGVFSRNVSADRLDQALALLLHHRRIVAELETTAGRAATRYRARHTG
jgi:hypothetical protein